jgi:AcrR family transcriptional regulator
MPNERVLSTAEQRRAVVVASAVRTFAQGGFRVTTIADVAADAGISPAYVSKLFPAKVELFVAALDECYLRILSALETGAEAAVDPSPAGVLHAMGAAYAELIADRDLLLLQVHAQAATDQPAIVAAVRRGIAQITDFASARSRAGASEVQSFIAFGQLCHLLTTVDAFSVDAVWATTLTAGIRHTNPVRS